MKKLICTFSLLCIIITACKKEDTNNNNNTGVDCSTVTYAGTIAGIATSKCNLSACHNSGSPNGDFTSYSALKAKFDNGSLKQRVIVEKSMPSGTSLTDTQYKQFECWVNAGAPNN